jgi:hypothetical protein
MCVAVEDSVLTMYLMFSVSPTTVRRKLMLRRGAPEETIRQEAIDICAVSCIHWQ